MDLSVNHLDIEGKMWNWLISPDISEKDRKNKSRSQYRTDFIKNHLQKSIRDLFHILPRSRKLKKEAIYDTFNALTLVDILLNLLLNVEQKSERRTEKYDFRTVELARMFYHVSTNYLMNSPIWQDEDDVKNDVNRVSTHFRILAKSALEKESHETIKQKEEDKIKKKLNSMKSDPEGDYQRLDKKRHDLLEEKAVYYEQLVTLDSLEKGARYQNKTEQADALKNQKEKVRTVLKDFSEKIEDVDMKRNEVLEGIGEEEQKAAEFLSHKYDNQKTVFCPFDRFGPFKNIFNNPHLPQDHPFSSLDLMFKPYYVYRYTDEKIQPQMVFPNYA